MRYAVVALGCALLVVLSWRWWLVHTGRSYFLPVVTLWRRRRVATALGCDGGDLCGGRTAKHAACVHCGRWTCQRGGYIDPRSHKRRFGAICVVHRVAAPDRQRTLTAERRQHDWDRLTDPIDESRLTLARLPEQFPGPTRASLRAFVHSDAEHATVDGITAGRLNESIMALGLSDQVYAEQRGHETVLRRVDA